MTAEEKKAEAAKKYGRKFKSEINVTKIQRKPSIWDAHNKEQCKKRFERLTKELKLLASAAGFE